MSDKKEQRPCAIYARVSTDHGLSQEFNSIDAQIDCCTHYIGIHAEDGWVLAGVYKDEGISGSTTERPALQQMLADVRDGKIKQVIVYKIDRLSRNLQAFLDMQALFSESGASMASATEPYDTSTYMGRAMLNLLGVFAEMERERIRERICDKIAAACAKGYWKGGLTPFGYKYVDHKLAIVGKYGEIVRDIYRMRSEGKFAQEIATALNKAGRYYYMPSKKAEVPWIPRRVNDVLRNPIYAGYITHKDKRYEGVHERIVPRTLWEKVQKLMDAEVRPRAKSTNETLPFPLRGVLYCGSCGGPMTSTYTRKGGKLHRYYSCFNKKSKGRAECDCPNLNADEVEDYLKKQLAKIVAQDADLAAAVIERLPDKNPHLVGDCLFNASRLIEYLKVDELAAAFRAVLSKVIFTPEPASFILNLK